MGRYRRARVADFDADYPATEKPVLIANSGNSVREDETAAPSRVARFLDVVEDPDGNVFPVWGVVRECQKTWEEEFEVIVHDCGGGNFVTISRELLVRGGALEDCTPDGSPCMETTLYYQEGSQTWTGELEFLGGTGTLEVYCTVEIDGIRWWLTIGGCAYTSTQMMVVLTEDPPSWTAPTGFGTLPCCGLPVVAVAFVISAKIRPYKMGRFVDVVNDKPVWAVEEYCPVDCAETTGCCPATEIDENLEYTIFDVDLCGCVPVEQTPAPTSGCRFFNFPACNTTAAISFCLSCVGYEEGRTWRNYRLTGGTDGIAYPASGSCDPFSVTFTNIPVTIIFLGDQVLNPPCYGTVSVTVTRP